MTSRLKDIFIIDFYNILRLLSLQLQVITLKFLLMVNLK